MILWLVGMMGSGKTSSGRLAASNLGTHFFDTDSMVAERMGCSVAQMWGTLGEKAFRDMEKVAVQGLTSRQGIASTGGGVVLDADNRDAMTESGPVVWLQASPEVLATRLAPTADRPGLVASGEPEGEFLTVMLARRSDLYDRVATNRILTDPLSVEETARRIEDIWRS